MKYLFIFIISLCVSFSHYGEQKNRITREKAIEIAQKEFLKITKSFSNSAKFKLVIEEHVFNVDSLVTKYPYFKSDVYYISKLLKKLKPYSFWYCKYFIPGALGGDLMLFINEKNGKIISRGN